MTSAELEAWVLQVVEHARQHHNIEESRVEAKGSQWPVEFPRAAGQLGGHANAARGEPILWLIGLDEKTGTVTSCDRQETSNWYNQIQARFDSGIAPTLEQSLVVPVGTESVVALLFSTDRAPYVLKADNPVGPVQRWVPWRDANATRASTREDLIKLLVPTTRLPDASVLGASLDLRHADPNTLRWSLSLKLYLVPRDRERVVLPHHECWAQVTQRGFELWRSVGPVIDEPSALQSQATDLVRLSRSDLIADGPGTVVYRFEDSAHAAAPDDSAPMDVTMHSRPAGGDLRLTVAASLQSRRPTSTSLLSWAYQKPEAWAR